MSTTELTALCTQYKELQRLKEEITAVFTIPTSSRRFTIN